MAKATLHKVSPATEAKPEPKQQLFFLRAPADKPALDPNPKIHLELAAERLKSEITNLEAVEQLDRIDEENRTVQAMSFAILAVLENLEEVHEHFCKLIGLIEPAAAGKGGEA